MRGQQPSQGKEGDSPEQCSYMKMDPGLVRESFRASKLACTRLSLQLQLLEHFPRYPIGHHSKSLVVLKFKLFVFQHLLKFILEKNIPITQLSMSTLWSGTHCLGHAYHTSRRVTNANQFVSSTTD